MKHKSFLPQLIFTLTLGFSITLSCVPGEDKSTAEIPKKIIPPDSMVLILTDMQVTEAILREYQRTGREDEKRNEKYYSQVFEKYGLSQKRYRESIDFYEQNPELYYKIYTDIISLLTKMQSEEKAVADEKK
jgi:hypothetical protein